MPNVAQYIALTIVLGLSVLAILYHVYKKVSRIRLVMSCFHDGAGQKMPVGFSWSQILVDKFKHKYNTELLLHGSCLKYGLNNQAYKAKYGTDNPWAEFLVKLHTEHPDVKIVICDLCMTEDGFNKSELLPFIEPIPFSIDYLAETATRPNSVAVFDAPI